MSYRGSFVNVYRCVGALRRVPQGRKIGRRPIDHDADIAKVQEWLGHANFATTQIRAADSPTFKARY
jgi:hypothetical protein